MKVVITGGLGFIGSHLCHRLSADSHSVLVIDSLTRQIHGDLPPSYVLPSGVAVARVDVNDLAGRSDLFDGVDIVYHLAAETGTGQSMYEIVRYAQVNCVGTASLLEAISNTRRPPAQLVLGSSRSVYGEGAYLPADGSGALISGMPRARSHLAAGRWDVLDDAGRPLKPAPTPENFMISPSSVYAATKASQEYLVRAACAAAGVQATIFRFQNVYGEGQSLRNPYTGIISIFFNRARQGLFIPIYEDGEESRDFVHVSDVVEVLARTAGKELPSGNVINVGSGEATSVKELATILLEASGFNVPIKVTGQYRLGDVRHCFASIELLLNYFGFKPQIRLYDGLVRFCDWAKMQPPYEDLSEVAVAQLKLRGLTD